MFYGYQPPAGFLPTLVVPGAGIIAGVVAAKNARDALNHFGVQYKDQNTYMQVAGGIMLLAGALPAHHYPYGPLVKSLLIGTGAGTLFAGLPSII